MYAMNKKSKSNMITLNLIPKENLNELKKSKSILISLTYLVFLNHSNISREPEEIIIKLHRQRPRTHKNSHN